MAQFISVDMPPQRRYPFSLLTSLITLLTISSLIVILLLSGFLDGVMKSVLEDMNQKLIVSKGDIASQKITAFINEPHQASQLITHSLKHQSTLTPSNVKEELLSLIRTDLADLNSISRVSYTSPSGRYIAFSRSGFQGKWHLSETNPTSSKQIITYQDASNTSDILHTSLNYDATSRDWFLQAKEKRIPFWSESHFQGENGKETTVSYHTPLFEHAHFTGVIAVDISSKQFTQFLNGLDFAHHSTLNLVSAHNRLLASSLLDPQVQPESQANVLKVDQWSDSLPLDALLSQAEENSPGGHKPFSVNRGNDSVWVQVRALQDKHHLLHWKLIIVTPDSLPVTIWHQHRNHMLMAIGLVIVLALIFCILVMTRFLKPLRLITERAKTITTNDHSWKPLTKHRLFPEIAELEKELFKASSLVIHTIHEQQKVIEQDPETKLATFSGLVAHPELIENRHLSAVIQLSNQPTMANTLGHQYSVRFLCDFVELLKQTLPKNTLFARVRSDIIAAILPGQYNEKDIQYINQKLERIFLNIDQKQNHLYTGNVGLIDHIVTADNVQSVLLNASIALYEAMEMGNGSICVFEPWMHDTSISNLRLHDQLREGIQNQEFHLVMQPIVSLEDSQNCIEAECLIRWHTEERGFIAPDKFIAIAEQTGLIIPLGRWIIETACQELATFIARGAPTHFKLHINIAALQFCQPDFAQHLMSCIERYQLHAENLCLEITESMMLSDISKVSHTLGALRDAGISIAIDDFGSGYSSLSYLHALPFDSLKIDRSFVSDILNNAKNEAVISSILTLARSFNVPLIAEGIETKEMSNKLYEMGCEKVQGYYFGRPQRFSEWHPNNGLLQLQIES